MIGCVDVFSTLNHQAGRGVQLWIALSPIPSNFEREERTDSS